MGGADGRRRTGRDRSAALLGALVGAAVGLAVSSGIYLTLVPVLEESTGLVRELQGLLWNVVPLLTAVGAGAGWWAVSRRSR